MRIARGHTQKGIAILMILLFLLVPAVLAAELRLTYDANGNLVTGDGTYRVYNSMNKLWKVYNGSDTNGPLLEELTHDPDENRVIIKKEYHNNGSLRETTYYFTQTFIRVINNSGTHDIAYIYHNGQLVAQKNNDSKTTYFHDDHLGSSSIVTNETGAIIENTTYTPYGEITEGGTTTRYDYTGKEYDDTSGDYDYHARRYNARFGIFTSPDGVISEVANPQNLNRYSYGLNNPYKYTDPDGHEVKVVDENSARVVYVNDVRIGTIVDGSEVVRSYEHASFTTDSGITLPGGRVNTYDYTVQFDNDPMMSNYDPEGRTASLNNVIAQDSKNSFRKENMERAGYVAQPMLGALSKASKVINYISNTITAASFASNFYGGDRVGMAQDAANFFLISSILLNTGLMATYESQGHQQGQRLPQRLSTGSSYRTARGVDTTIASTGRLRGGGSYSVSKSHKSSYGY